MAIEKIAEMFAELGFKVDTKGLVAFEKHLSKLKEDFTGIKSATIKTTDATVKSDKAVARSSRTKTNALIADRNKLRKALSKPINDTYGKITKGDASMRRNNMDIRADNRRRKREANKIASELKAAENNSLLYEKNLFSGKVKRSVTDLDTLLGINRGGGDLAKQYAGMEKADAAERAKYEKKLFSGKASTTVSNIDTLLGVNRPQSDQSKLYAADQLRQEKQALKESKVAANQKAAADKKAARESNQYKQALDGIVRKMNPLQSEYEQLKRHQDMLNKEMADGTGDAKRYEASLARIQSRLKQLDGMRGANGDLPFREATGSVGRPSGSNIGLSASTGLFGAFGAVAAGIGTNRLQMSTEQTQAKMEMVLSPEEAAEQIKFASDSARELGVNAVEAASGYANLMVQATRMGIPLQDTQNLFMGVSEASIAMGLSLDNQKGIYKAFSDMLAKGTVNAEELKQQLGDRLPGAVKLAADSMGVGTDELMKMMEANQLAADKFLPLFSVALRESVREGGALEKMMQGTAAQMGRFGNSVNDAALAFSRGGFNKALTDFLERATKTMDALTKSGFFDTLGFAFRMLVAPINAVMEVVGGLADIFRRARDEGGEYAEVVKRISIILGILLLPALLAIGRALAPVLLVVAGVIALGDMLQGLAGKSSEFKTNWDALTKSIKEGSADWQAFFKIAGQVAAVLGGIVISMKAISKLNPFKGGAKSVAAKAGTVATVATGAKLGVEALAKNAFRAASTLVYSGKVGEGSDQIYDANGNLKPEFAKYNPNNIVTHNPDLPMFGRNNRIENMKRVDGNMPELPMFDANNTMINSKKRTNLSATSPQQISSAPSVVISNMNINGDSAPEGLRTNVEDYMNSVFDDVFKDAMRETIR